MTDTSRALKYEAVTPVRWSSSDAGDRFAVENPATGEIITDVQGSGPAEVGQAILAAHAAFQGAWRWTSPQQRSILLSKCADVLEEHADELAAIETHENGKPLACTPTWTRPPGDISPSLAALAATPATTAARWRGSCRTTTTSAPGTGTGSDHPTSGSRVSNRATRVRPGRSTTSPSSSARRSASP
jgi:hypothetical protein